MTAWATLAAGLLCGAIGIGCGGVVNEQELDDAHAEYTDADADADADAASTSGDLAIEHAVPVDGAEAARAGDASAVVRTEFIHCGSHFPLCPQDMECQPIRGDDGDVAIGYCR